MRKTITTGALVLAAMAPAATANAAEDDVIDRYFNVATGRVLDDSAEHGLRVMPDYGNDHQAWVVHARGDGSVEISNVATGNCLDDSFEADLRSFPCNGLAYQDWYGTLWADGTVTLVNKATGRAVDDSFEFGLRAFERNDGPSQRW